MASNSNKNKAKVTTAKPKSLDLSRADGVKVKATWSLSSAQKKDYNRLGYKYTLKSSGKNKKGKERKNVTWQNSYSSTNHTTRTVNLNDITIGSRSWTRGDWYPYTPYKMTSVTMGLWLYQVENNKTKRTSNKASDSITWKPPKKPSVAISYAENGQISITVTPAADSGVYERELTVVTITRQANLMNLSTGKITLGAVETKVKTGITRDTAQTWTYDETQRAVTDDEWIKWTVTAKSQGFAGDSDTVSASKIISQPARATLLSKVSKTSTEEYPKLVRRDPNASTISSADSIVFALKTNASSYHPVDGLRIEVLKDSEYTTADSIPASAQWDSTDFIDRGQCERMQCDAQSLQPIKGTHTWARLKTWHDYESIHYVYSKPIEVSALYRPAETGVDDPIDVLSVTTGTDGESLIVVLGWNKDHVDDATSTELSWSDAEDTWQSTEEPSIYDFTWYDATPPTGYGKGATVTIKGLTMGTPYYVTARRHTVTEAGGDAYSAYASKVKAVPLIVPKSVTLDAPPYLPYGSDAQFSWSYDSEAPQTAWRLMPYNMGVDGAIADGSDASGFTAVKWADIAKVLNGASILQCYVEVDVGNGYVTTRDANGNIIPSTVSIVAAPVVTALAGYPVSGSDIRLIPSQPVSVALTSTVPAGNAIVKVLSNGISAQGADGDISQARDECVWSGEIQPTWTESSGSYTSTIELPSGLDLIDGCRYRVTVQLEATMPDRTSVMLSNVSESTAEVNWARKAPSPSESITIVPETVTVPATTTDAEYVRHICTINLVPPEDVASTDVYDVYRMTADKAYLVASGYPTTHTAVDEYAPYGDGYTGYRIVCRTVDGSTQWDDYEYDLDVDVLRFDFGVGQWLELPYNIAIDNDYKGDYETRMHLDGTVSGYFNEGYTRSAGLDTDVVRIDDDNQRTIVKALGAYSGGVFVRTPAGEAYLAAVDVSDNSSAGSAITSVSIKATEIELSEDYQMPAITANVEDGS